MNSHSLRIRLLQWLVIPLFCLSLGSATIGYFLTVQEARDHYDDELLNSADSVIGRIDITANGVSVDMPEEALSILRHDNEDLFLYELFADGRPICGNFEFPVPAFNTEMQYGTTRVSGRFVRTLTMMVPAYASHGRRLMLVAAETTRSRDELVKHILVAVMLPQVLLTVCGGVAILFGVQKGLNQLAEIRKSLSLRSSMDLQPLAVRGPSEIAPLVDTLNKLLGELREDIERQRRFASNAAHQLRTPLAGLATYCDLALRYASQDNVKDLLLQIQSGITRMASLVNQLLILAQCEPTVSSTLHKKIVDLNEVVATAAAEVAQLAVDKKQDLEFEPWAVPVHVAADTSSLQELIKNLVDNAVKYTPVGGRILLGVYVGDDGACLYIEDTGCGIPEAEQSRVFERFYRVPDTGEPGTGLGLAIVQDIADGHHATIAIGQGSSGIGTRFTVHFATEISGKRQGDAW